ncbi:discoidin domain-containing protein, partial [Brenneria nigrifluens]
LEAGPGVTLGQNPVSGKTIISASGGGSGGGGGYIVVDRPSATAEQNHSFSFSVQSAFNLTAYALKEVAGATNQTYVIDDFNAESELDYDATNAAVFDGSLKPYTGSTQALMADGAFYSTDVRSDGEYLSLQNAANSIIPAMTSNTTPTGYVASASSQQSPYLPYRAFDATQPNNTYQNSWVSSTAPSESSPQWLRIDLPSKQMITRYTLINRPHTSNNPNDVFAPISWTLQGSDNGTDWDNIHSVVDDDQNIYKEQIRNFELSSPVSYANYRLLFTKSYYTRVSLHKFIIMSDSKFIIGYDGSYYTAENGQLTEITDEINSETITQRGVTGINKLDTESYTGMFRVISVSQFNIKSVYFPYSQIVINQQLMSAAAWSQINSATLTATQT